MSVATSSPLYKVMVNVNALSGLAALPAISLERIKSPVAQEVLVMVTGMVVIEASLVDSSTVTSEVKYVRLVVSTK